MKFNRRIYVSIFWVVLGFSFILAGSFELTDSYWSGMGGGLMAVGIIQLVRHIRTTTNPEYRETLETESKDERNRFLAMKAWSWAGYLYVMIAAVGSIVCKLLGREYLMIFCGFSVCIIILLYWASWMWLRKKY